MACLTEGKKEGDLRNYVTQGPFEPMHVRMRSDVSQSYLRMSRRNLGGRLSTAWGQFSEARWLQTELPNQSQ